jgi:hypothetical protein
MAHVIAAVVLIGVAAAFIAVTVANQRKVNVGVAQAFAIDGPPCPSLTEAEFTAKHYKAPKVFDYDGVAIGRLAGNVSCSDVKTEGGKGLGVDKVCQFTGPATITVTLKTGRVFYVPGVGQPASLIIHDDVPRCVMASNYKPSDG